MDTLGTTLQAVEAGARVSGIAVVRWVGPRKDVRTWSGAVVAKRECEVVDATLRPTTLAVWGYDKVVALGKLKNEIVSYTGRASDWRGRSLNADKIEKVRSDEIKQRFFAPGVRAYVAAASSEARDAYAVTISMLRDASVGGDALYPASGFVATYTQALPAHHILQTAPSPSKLAAAIWRDVAKRKRLRVRLKKHVWPLLDKLARNYASPKIGELFRKSVCGEDVVDAKEAARFVVRACRSIVPRAFFGHKRNERRYYRALDAFIRAGDVGGRVDARRLREVLAESAISWTHARQARRPASDLRTARELLETFCLWVLTDVALPLLKARLVAFPSAQGPPAYRSKVAWRAAEAVALGAATHLRQVPKTAPRPRRSARVRGVPKPAGGVRLIQVLGRRGAGQRAPGAACLHDTVLALRVEARRRPELLGCAGGGSDALWRALRKAAARNYAGLALDASGCFDCMDQRRLVDICVDALAHDSYRIHGGKRASIADDRGGLNAKRTRLVAREALVGALQAHCLDHFTAAKCAGRLGFYKQVVGVPQGSCASSLLCDLYYGNFERDCLGRFLQSSLVACRVVDDTLVLGTDVGGFLDAYVEAGPRFNILVKAAKTHATIKHHLLTSAPAPQLSFLGLEVDAATGRARRAPITQRRRHLAARLGRPSPRAANVAGRLRAALRARATPLLLDAELQTLDGARENLRDLFTAAAVAAESAVRALRPSSTERLRSDLRGAVGAAFSAYLRARRKANLVASTPRLSRRDFVSAARTAFAASSVLRPFLVGAPGEWREE